jgi:hypothetical protein
LTTIRVDLHSHTRYSFDSSMPPEVLVDRCVRRGIGALAVTEHNNIDGALAVQQIAPFKVIIAEEIKTNQGEIIGLFLKQPIPRGLTPEETVARIKSQGGLAAIPHPFDRFRSGSAIKRRALESVADDIDIMEAFNCRTTLLRDSERAEAFGREHGMALGVGSDSHTPFEIGGGYVEMEDFDLRSPQDFLAKLREGTIVAQRANPLVHVPTRLVKSIRQVRRLLSVQ